MLTVEYNLPVTFREKKRYQKTFSLTLDHAPQHLVRKEAIYCKIPRIFFGLNKKVFERIPFTDFVHMMMSFYYADMFKCEVFM